MKLTSAKKKLVILFLLLPMFFSGCNAKAAGQKKFGADADYFIGLQKKAEGKQNEARAKFNRCIKKGSFYCARKSAQELTTLGSVQEKNQASIRLVQQFSDEESLFIAANQLFSAHEYAKVLEITDKINLATDKNELISLRLKALQKKGSSSYKSAVFEWFTSRPVSQIHYDFYRDFYQHPDFDAEEVETSVEDFVMNYRIKAYKRDYLYCFNNATVIFNYFENHQIRQIPQIASDLGKAFLYGSTEFGENAQFFRSFAQENAENDVNYYFWFYAARLYQKTNSNVKQAEYCFLKAIETARDDAQKDNAIWYLLDSSLKNSLGSITELISIYSKQWKNPEYFDDFFENLAISLLASGKWDSFYQIYTMIDGYATDETVGQYAYIYGRLLQEGYGRVAGDVGNGSSGGGAKDLRGRLVREAFERATQSGSSSYYRIMAAYQLGLKGEDLKAVLYKGTDLKINQNEENKFGDGSQEKQAIENLLLGYAAFGFPELIYENYMDLYKKGISTETSIYLADFLKKCAVQNHEYYTQSLRITSRAVTYGGKDFTSAQLKFFYPDNFVDLIRESCKKYDIDDSVMLALIRSESFFAPEVVSSAGAIGLCQLMESTAADVAKKLKISDYDLTDPKTNIEFGTYYLAELYRRCDNSYLQAFLSYNAGISRVRRWLKSSLIEFGAKKDMPADLFLETVPYSETRGYGRKLISATAMYEWLYSNDDEVFYKKLGELLE